MKDITSFYDEGPTKTKTRLNIVNAAIALFSENGIDIVSMKDIAALSQITTRNLYRYYPSKEYLAVDSAYQIMHTSGINMLTPEVQGATGIEQLESAIRSIYKIEKTDFEDLQFIRFIMYFDLYLYKMDIHHPAYVRYTNEYVPNINNRTQNTIYNIIKTGLKDGTIHMNERDIPLYCEYILQSFISLLMRTMLKEKENKAINQELVELHIKTIFEYLQIPK